MSAPADARLTVLVVEDNPGDAMLIEETLTADPADRIRLLYATSLGQALSQLDELPPDVVLLDLGLPDGNGVGCVERLRRGNRHLPIVVLTGLNDEQMAMECLAAGAQDYLCKDSVLSHNVRRAIDYAIARKNAYQLMARSDELEQENVKIQEVNRAKSQFIASMSHELRTPLNAIIGFSEMLRKGIVAADSKDYHKSLDHICTSSKHLLDLINDILDLAKIEAGKAEFKFEQANVADLIGEVVDICDALIKEKSISVTVSNERQLDELYVDALRFKQILYNFLSNALKFTPRGGRAAIRTFPEGSHHFRLEVEDNGAGIASEEVPRLFEDFHQVGPHTQLARQGTGLGLSLTKRLVEAQGGHVGVLSTVGKGSLFYAVLPRRPL
ncbi:MAG TPA: ATP-binding protein, partial [Duganella sp.]|nr:ATP-binding protein [Duganella sp.]